MSTDAIIGRSRFLAALPDRERQRVSAMGEIVSMEAGAVLHGTGQVISGIFFPLDSVAALNTAIESGAGATVAMIGAEGLAGATALLGGTNTSWNEAAVQIGGTVLRVPFEGLRQEVARSAPLRQLLQRYAQALLVQVSQSVACSRFHPVEQRLARLLLAVHDRIEGDDIRITHERLAAMLGTFRPSATLAAQHLQDQGSIGYRRGRITITDRALLVGSACECYDVVASEYERLLTSHVSADASAMFDTSDETLRELNSRLMTAAIREQRAREDAERANDMAGHLLATLSHELRAPLTAILGWSDLLESGDLDEETLSLAIETIRRNAEAQKRLVNDMFDLSRLRSGKLALQLEAVDVAAAVREAVTSSRPAADASHVAITVFTDEPLRVQADPVRLQQLLTNLLSHALKSTPPGGAIEVTARPVDANVEISVCDTGHGIEPELLPHVFEQFRQGDAARRGELGMGLGLAIVRQLTMLHGGAVRVASRGIGAGTTFTVTLPGV